jgi:proteasome-associated ATPase
MMTIAASGEIESLRWQLKQANDALARIREKPHVVATIGAPIGNGRAMVYWMHFQLALKLPDGAKPGDQCYVTADTSSITTVLTEPTSFGNVVKVSRVQGDSVLSDQGLNQVAAYLPPTIDAKVGDTVQLDPTGHVVLRNLSEATNASDYVVQESPDVAWDAIGGCEPAKQALREAIEYPVTHAELYRAYGQTPSRGVLLYGPPGTGKTMLGKAVATALAADTGSVPGFIYVKAAEVLTKWVGGSELAIRDLFERAHKHKRKTGVPAVLFIDEADALLGAREGSSVTLSMGQTVVPTFLAEMDGIQESGAIVILSTNRPDALDAAVIRDGRIDRKVHVPRPDRESATKIFHLALNGRKLDAPADDLATRAIDMVFGERATLSELHFQSGTSLKICMSDAISGAMVSGIVRRATELAIKRDREAGTLTGLRVADVEEAVKRAYAELSALRNPELVREKCMALGVDPIRIEKRVGRVD